MRGRARLHETKTRALAAMGAAALIAGCGGHTTSGPSSQSTDNVPPPAQGGSPKSQTDGDASFKPTDNVPPRVDGGSVESPVDPARPATESVCKFNSDCSAALVCVAGVCHSPCAQSKDCPANQRCVDEMDTKVCLLSAESACTVDSNCTAPLVCARDRACRNTCLANRDCIAGELCATSHVCANPVELDATGDVAAR